MHPTATGSSLHPQFFVVCYFVGEKLVHHLLRIQQQPQHLRSLDNLVPASPELVQTKKEEKMDRERGNICTSTSCAGDLGEQIYLAVASSHHYLPFMDRDKLP